MAGVEGSICKKQGAKARFHNAKYSTREWKKGIGVGKIGDWF